MPVNAGEELAVSAGLVGYASEERYRARADFLFRGIPIAGKRVLDVGTGPGAWAIWAALNGAGWVVALEPEADGSSRQVFSALCRNLERLDLTDRVSALPLRLQDLPPQTGPFDVAILFNVINHLDEEAVVRLHEDRQAFARYVGILRLLRSLMRDGGWAIVADCARRNFWNQIGLTSPLARPIEWHKHQDPELWKRLFGCSGFAFADLRWSPFQPLPRITSNWLAQYLTSSHFVLRVRAI